MITQVIAASWTCFITAHYDIIRTLLDTRKTKNNLQEKYTQKIIDWVTSTFWLHSSSHVIFCHLFHRLPFPLTMWCTFLNAPYAEVIHLLWYWVSEKERKSDLCIILLTQFFKILQTGTGVYVMHRSVIHFVASCVLNLKHLKNIISTSNILVWQTSYICC